MTIDSSPEALRELARGVVDLVSPAELASRIAEGKPLRVKAGFDPTRPDLHLGHVVLMNKLRQFQEFGHTVVFIVGDFTAQVGDPTGRNKARPPVTREEVLEGARTYAEQAFKVLDPARTEIRHNSEWLDALKPQDMIRLAAKRTVARTMERRDFRERFESQKDIYLHEFLYPLFQAYDSVVIDADIELGGTDQLFNLNVGRDLMTAYDKRAQMVMTTPLLEGLDARMVDGKVIGDKMSKSADNYVGVNEPPAEMYRKLVGVNDGVVWRYYELLSAESSSTIDALKRDTASDAVPPREAQKRFAREMVTRFHSADAAREAEARYEHNRAGGFPSDAPTVNVSVEAGKETAWIARVISTAGLAESNADARRLIKSGAVKIDGEKVTDEQLQLARGRTCEVTVGGKTKRYARIVVE